jgi:hypothetical protein
MSRLICANKGASGATGKGKKECRFWEIRFRRRQVSVSAGFCMDQRSSLTEMTGNNMTRSMTSATRGMRLWAPVRCSKRIHRPKLMIARQVQARLRKISTILPDSTSRMDRDEKGRPFLLRVNGYNPTNRAFPGVVKHREQAWISLMEELGQRCPSDVQLRYTELSPDVLVCSA